ncbi:MAG: hypothetical protein OEM29_04080 [Thermoplasmata archaeon]|nr:hypothetical protein [Thermoplasmata archaeon]
MFRTCSLAPLTKSFARKMLDAGKVDKAVDALTNADCEIALEAIELMISLLESQCETELVAAPVEAWNLGKP